MIPEVGKKYNIRFEPEDGCGAYTGVATFNGGFDEKLDSSEPLYSFDIDEDRRDFLFANEDILSEA